MASGNRSGYGSWELDKGESNLDYCDVGLGLRIPWQQQHQQQQQQQRQQSPVSWLQNCQNHSENSRSPSPSPAISGFSIPSRFGDGGRESFTAGQRQELERQTMIFKYMMASIPVPPDLLVSLSKYPSSATTTPSSGRKAGVEMRYGGNRGGDAEPWRCRRTDGKKWRCSRDVAPDQKYCERHSHKGRPSRSRKPVESASASLTSSSTTSSSSSSSLSHLSPTLPVTTLVTPSVSTCNPIIFTPFSIPKPTSSSFDLPSPPQFNPLPRYPDWFMKKEVAPSASSCLFPHHIGGGETRSTVDDHQSCLLSRPFIDAWSLGDHVDPKDGDASNSTNNNSNAIDSENNNCITTDNKCPPPSSPLHSILPLTLSMSAGIDSEYHHDSEDPTKDNPEIRLSSSSHHHQPLNWMSSWISSPPGGPLAEALCLGISGAGNGIPTGHSDELVSPHGHSTGSSTTTLG